MTVRTATAIADRLAADGYAFPVDALGEAEAEGFRRRIEALEKGTVGRGPQAQRLYRFKPYLLFAWARELVGHPRVLDAVEQAIGPDIMIWAAGLFIKEPHDPTPIRWHQDGVHMHVSDSEAAVRAWIALTPTTVANGTMSFIPGSHRAGYLPHAEDDANAAMALRGEHIARPEGQDRAVPVCLRPGQMSLHHLRTVHGSPGNRTAERRITLAVTYLAPHVRPLAGADTATLLRGEDRHGNWQAEPALPRHDHDPACAEAHRRSMETRLAAYHGTPMPGA